MVTNTVAKAFETALLALQIAVMTTSRHGLDSIKRSVSLWLGKAIQKLPGSKGRAYPRMPSKVPD